MDYFVGIDSDGTVFDSMNIKHKKVFVPAAFEVFDLKGHEETFASIWEEINLYSRLRGVNRFIGLLTAFERLDAQGIKPHDYSSLASFLNSSFGLSNTGLVDFLKSSGEPFVKRIYDWSKRSDELFAIHNQGQPPFEYVTDALRLIIKKSYIVVVSSASLSSISKDWTESGLMEFVSHAMGQESGTKTMQIKSAAGDKFRSILMIGDAPGDLEAARANNAMFYPIIPGREAECWKKLIDEAYDKFLNGAYSGVYEDTLIESFNASLS